MHSLEYQAADAALDGRMPPPAVPSAKACNDCVELKMCELCPRLFARPVGSKHKYCADCRTKSRMEAFKGRLLRFFELPHHRGSGPYKRTRRAHARDKYFDPDRKKPRCLSPTN